MQRFLNGAAAASLLGLGVAGTAGTAAAQFGPCDTATGNNTVSVNADIVASTTWTAGNTYDLNDIIYVQTGATLTIEAGTVIASDTGGALVVTRGAQIHVLGTTDCPVVMTSKADRNTWTNGDPQTGSWRTGAQEWGNLTIMGNGFISENLPASFGNTPTPNAANEAQMEGLTSGTNDDRYGGGDDDDDSGTIQHLSIRFGGQTTAQPTVELNGISLGALGRGTDLHYLEIMNNVDDGIEIWGGALNLKYVSVWNVGDDSFDFDQGWRGKAQFGLIVQGYSINQSQGSGVGDNCIEHDGAEDCHYQPWSTASIWNFTCIGQPLDNGGDHGTAWRDNARVQYNNCIFMDLGEQLVKFDNSDGDGARGYGCSPPGGGPATLTWAQTWTTAYNATPAYPPSDPSATVDPTVTLADLYQAQTDGNLAQIRNSIFFRNTLGGGSGTQGDAAYTEAVARGVFAGGNNNTLIPGFADADAPVTSLLRGTPVTIGGKEMWPVVTLNPRPANEALSSNRTAPADGFFTAADYVGAFKPADISAGSTPATWLAGWSASTAFGLVQDSDDSVGVPTCFGDGSAAPCACDNLGGAGEGCAHGFASGIGAKLTASGNPSVNNDSLVLRAAEISNQPGLFFQGVNSILDGEGVAFGDGLRCCGGSVVRLQVINPPGTAALHISGSTNVTISDQGPNNTVNPGDTKCYQYWYRTPGVWNACGATFNLSNSVIITWLP